MAFIRTIPASEAEGPVREMYEPSPPAAFPFNDLDPALRQSLTVGRPITDRPA